MAIWIVTSLCILLVTITALVKVRAFFGKVFLIILGLAGLAGTYLAHDRYESLMATIVSGIISDSNSVDSQADVQPPASDSLGSDIAAKRSRLDSLNTRYEQLNRQIVAAERRLDSVSRATKKWKGASKTDPGQATTKTTSSIKLGARLGESIRMPDGKFRRIDVFRGISPGEIKNVSIHIRFDNRFDGLIISQEGPDGVPRGNCPQIDTVYSSAFFDYECNLLANGTGIVVTTFSEFPLMIEDIAISPK